MAQLDEYTLVEVEVCGKDRGEEVDDEVVVDDEVEVDGGDPDDVETHEVEVDGADLVDGETHEGVDGEVGENQIGAEVGVDGAELEVVDDELGQSGHHLEEDGGPYFGVDLGIDVGVVECSEVACSDYC